MGRGVTSHREAQRSHKCQRPVTKQYVHILKYEIEKSKRNPKRRLRGGLDEVTSQRWAQRSEGRSHRGGGKILLQTTNNFFLSRRGSKLSHSRQGFSKSRRVLQLIRNCIFTFVSVSNCSVQKPTDTVAFKKRCSQK